MNKKLSSLVTSIAAISLLAACGTDNGNNEEVTGNAETVEPAVENIEEENNTSELNEENNSEEIEEEAATEITVDHELGQTVVPANPENIVVFDFGTLDTLQTIGVEPIAVPQGNIPAYLSDFESDAYENAGTLFEPDFEALFDMDPDLIIISGRTAEAYEELSDIAPTLYLAVDTANYVETFTENALLLGEIFGAEEEIERALADIETEIEELNTLAQESGERALFTMANEGALNAYGIGSRFGVIHDEFGVAAADENIEDANHGQNVSFEYVLEVNPDILFVMDRGAVVAGESDQTAQDTIENELVMQTTAYQENKVIYLDPGYWYLSSGGLQSVAAMVAETKQAFE